MNHNSLHIRAVPTPEELSKAYKRARLRQIGVSYQRAIMTPASALPCIAPQLLYVTNSRSPAHERAYHRIHFHRTHQCH